MAEVARPIHDRIIVRVESAETVSKGGIEIVSMRKVWRRCGEVLAVGPGIISEKTGKLIPTTLKPGDRVVFGSYAGTEIEVGGETYRVMREGDVACVADPEAEISTDGLLSSKYRQVSSFYNK